MAYQRHHDLRHDVEAFLFADLESGRDDGLCLHLCDLRICDSQSASAVSQHRVELVELESLVYYLLYRLHLWLLVCQLLVQTIYLVLLSLQLSIEGIKLTLRQCIGALSLVAIIEVVILVVEIILQTNLQSPAVRPIHIRIVGLGWIFAIHLIHSVYGNILAIYALVSKDSAVVRYSICLRNTPTRVNQVANVHEVKTCLELMRSATYTEYEVLGDAKVKLVNPRSASSISLSILTLMVLQITILLYETPESSTLRRIVNEVAICVDRTDLDFVVVSGNIHQVVIDTITVHVVGVAEAITAKLISSIEQTDVRTAQQSLVAEWNVIIQGTNHLVGNYIYRTLSSTEIRTIHGYHALPC